MIRTEKFINWLLVFLFSLWFIYSLSRDCIQTMDIVIMALLYAEAFRQLGKKEQKI